MPQKIRTAALMAVIALLIVTTVAGCTAPRESAGPESTPTAPVNTPSAPPASTPAGQPEAPVAEYRKISAEEARDMLSGAEEYILLDVRTDEEFAEQHIGGAVLIPDFEIADRAETNLPDKNALILIYCRSGRRSALAAQELVALGYTNVYDFGGIMDWPYEVE